MTREEKLPKEAEWGEEDEIYLSQAIETLEHENYLILAEKLKSLRLQPKQKWSEEDEHNLNSVISLVHNTSDGAWGSCIGDRIENWLKSLRPNKQK